MAESEKLFVKIGEDGQYIEREVGSREIDRINLQAMGFVPKGSKGAPKPSDGVTLPPADSNDAPTSLKAAEQRADAETVGKTKP